MDLKNRIFLVITRVICAIFLIIALFLGITAVVFSVSGGVPNVFGSNVYLVKTDAFELLHEGTALIASETHPMDIQPGNIVIFNLENGEPALAEILTSELSDGVYSFTARIENNNEIFLSQSQIVAKGQSFSDFWGAVITFAISPVGMLFIAILPCLAVVIVEVSKFFRKVMPQPEIQTVKKQYEVPTYTPESSRRRPAERKQRSESDTTESAAGKAAAFSAYKTATLDDSLGIYETQAKKSAYYDDDIIEVSKEQDNPLFTSPVRKRTPNNTTRTPVSATRSETMPLSQKKLNEAIAASKAEREMAEMQKQRAEAVREIKKTRNEAIAAEKEAELAEIASRRAAEKAAEPPVRAAKAEAKKPEPVKQAQPEKSFTPEFTAPTRQSKPTLKLSAEESVKQYTPKRSEHVTTSIPRLDALLNDDSDNSGGYSIDDILAGLEKRSK